MKKKMYFCKKKNEGALWQVVGIGDVVKNNIAEG